MSAYPNNTRTWWGGVGGETETEADRDTVRQTERKRQAGR